MAAGGRQVATGPRAAQVDRAKLAGSQHACNPQDDWQKETQSGNFGKAQSGLFRRCGWGSTGRLSKLHTGHKARLWHFWASVCCNLRAQVWTFSPSCRGQRSITMWGRSWCGDLRVLHQQRFHSGRSCCHQVCSLPSILPSGHARGSGDDRNRRATSSDAWRLLPAPPAWDADSGWRHVLGVIYQSEVSVRVPQPAWPDSCSWRLLSCIICSGCIRMWSRPIFIWRTIACDLATLVLQWGLDKDHRLQAPSTTWHQKFSKRRLPLPRQTPGAPLWHLSFWWRVGCYLAPILVMRGGRKQCSVLMRSESDARLPGPVILCFRPSWPAWCKLSRICDPLLWRWCVRSGFSAN